MIDIKQLTYHYQSMTFHFNLRIAAGESVTILGPSGAGKSTLLNLIAGFIYADSGSLWLAGVDHTCSAPDQRPVSMLFQENNLFAHLTVEQNIALGLKANLRLTPIQREQCQQMMARSGLRDLAHRLPAQLSGGQRQRVALSRCLLRQRPILILDEPFSALDPALRSDMLNLVNEMRQERQLTLLMVSHNLDDAMKMAKRSLIIADGALYYDGELTSILTGKHSAAQLLGIKMK